MKKEFLYFDSAAACRPHPLLGEWYRDLLERYWLNPHGGTCYGEECRRVVLGAERRLLACLGILEEEARVVWTSGVTEAMNLAILGTEYSGTCLMDVGGHAALRRPCEALQVQGRHVEVAGMDRDGRLQVESSGEEGLLVVSHVNNETGAIQNLERLRGIAPRFLLAVDAAQSFCRHVIPWREAHVDILALSSRKVGGPASVGALIIRRGIKMRARILGGGQQWNLRSGTVDVIGAELFTRVVEEKSRSMVEHGRHVQQLSDFLWGALDGIGRPWVRISPKGNSPWIAMFAFPGFEGALVSRIMAEQEGILISSSSACSAETHETSPALAAMGISPELSRSAIRVSFGVESTLEEVQALVSALGRVLENY